MTSTIPPDSIATAGKRRRDAMIGFLSALLFGALLIAFNGGQPQSVWFYPYMVALGISVGYYRPKIRRADWEKGVLGPVQPIPVALAWASIRGVVSGLIIFTALKLGHWERSDVFLCAVFTIWPAVDDYRYRRGLKYNKRAMVYVIWGVIAALIIILIALKILSK